MTTPTASVKSTSVKPLPMVTTTYPPLKVWRASPIWRLNRDVRHETPRRDIFRDGHRVVNRPRAIYDAVAARRRTRIYGIHMLGCSIRCREGKGHADSS